MVWQRIKKALKGNPLRDARWELATILSKHALPLSIEPLPAIRKIADMAGHARAEALTEFNKHLSKKLGRLGKNARREFFKLAVHSHTVEPSDVQTHLDVLAREGAERHYYDTINLLTRDHALGVAGIAAENENADAFLEIVRHSLDNSKIYPEDFEHFVKIAGHASKPGKEKERETRPKLTPARALLDWVKATKTTKGKLDLVEALVHSKARALMAPVAEYAAAVDSGKAEAMLLQALIHSDEPELMGDKGIRKALSDAGPTDKKQAEQFAEIALNAALQKNHLPETFSYLYVLKKRLTQYEYAKMLERACTLKDPQPFLKSTHKKIFKLQERIP